MNKFKRIKNRSFGSKSIFLLMFLLGVWVETCLAQESNIDLNALIQDTQKQSQNTGEMSFVWWMPEEFWRVSLMQDRTITTVQAEEFIKVLRPYMVIVVVDGKIGAFGGITYISETTIRDNIELIDSHGARYRPLSQQRIDADTENFLSIMKPVFANMLGPMGQNMHFILFPAKNTNGENIAEPKKKGSFVIKLGENEFKWKLPLTSLLPLKICPKCAEKCSGAWNFCPWCGTELSK